MYKNYKIGDVVMKDWELTQMLGSEVFFDSFLAEQKGLGKTNVSCVKITSIPQGKSEVEYLRKDGLTDEEIREKCEKEYKGFMQECQLMSKMSDIPNVVAIQEYQSVPHEGWIGWDVFIRTEKTTPLYECIGDNSLSQRDVIKLGIDICKALEACLQRNVIHGHVNFEHVVVDSRGDCKLADWDEAYFIRTAWNENAPRGFVSCWAPEVVKGEAMGTAADIYSLGLMMYRCLNGKMEPFMPLPPKTFTFNDRMQAYEKRLSGQAWPMPSQADKRLGEIVLKACAYKPEDRFASPGEMRRELEGLLN